MSNTRTVLGVPAGGSKGLHGMMNVQPALLYNGGNDDIENMNRFSFPAVSFSPSFALPSHGLLSPSPRSPAGGAGGLLSPRSHFSPNSPESASQPSSPMPPLSPRGLRFADAERAHKVKCFDRILEKRRKASDGTSDIITLEPASVSSSVPTTWLQFGHSRRVSFKLASDRPTPTSASLPASLPSSSGATTGSSSGSGSGSGSRTNSSDSHSPSRLEFRFSVRDEDLECFDSSPSSPVHSDEA
ncbi:MAG: hypothetical protein CYPHOPRED_005725 [Cyphobasidiales sp. Tagirdzhanova-0007]|nr:MAG: hypothetical protein CYPHOPRED_005725 [Cyphobasidiales sp. Tagirdzhanova-0007]